MKVAIAHDWLVVYGGAERVLEQLINLFPQADLYTLVDFIPPDERAFLKGRPVTTSFIQHLPGARSHYRHYLPLMPMAIEQFDLSGYDLVISSSYAVAKGVITGPDQVHISYVHSPIRYAWDLQHQYLREARLDKGALSWLSRWVLHKMRIWDIRSAHGTDFMIANSGFVARRIRKTYRREAAIIYPPVYIDSFDFSEQKEDFYLTASRLVPYKRIDLIVEAFSAMPDRALYVIGDGPELKKIRKKAGRNVVLLGYQPDPVLKTYMKQARAFIFAAEEDFGIVPLEAQACGTPVIAYGRGGALETVRGLDSKNPTGMFFYEQSSEAIIDAISLFDTEGRRIRAQDCRENASRFGIERFKGEFNAFINQALAQYYQH